MNNEIIITLNGQIVMQGEYINIYASYSELNIKPKYGDIVGIITSNDVIKFELYTIEDSWTLWNFLKNLNC